MDDPLVMFVIMIISGLLSTMGVWATQVSDIRITLNDIYMAFLMTGWMFFMMGFYYRMPQHALIGLGIAALTLVLIRYQVFITPDQYIQGMIPHHSMAVHMSKRLKENHVVPLELRHFADEVIRQQSSEIEWLKTRP